jgi:hypothetical protein
MQIHRAVLALCLLLVPTVAAADCLYNGKQYSEGTRIGTLVCQDGKWILPRSKS